MHVRLILANLLQVEPCHGVLAQSIEDAGAVLGPLGLVVGIRLAKGAIGAGVVLRDLVMVGLDVNR